MHFNLEVVLKIVERCNIDCKYCYYINGAGATNTEYPPYISKETVDKIVFFLKEGCENLSIKKLNIYLHGGEPLMLKKSVFDYLCDRLYLVTDKLTNLKIHIQTNGILLSEEWLEILGKHKVSVGVSLDGPEEYNDMYRIDHHQRGTYTKTIAGLNLLLKYAELKKIDEPSILCVINPTFSARKIYHHFVKEIGIKNMDFLLPDVTKDMLLTDSSECYNADEYGKFLVEIFDEWVKDDNPEIYIRTLNNTMFFLMDFNGELKKHNRENRTIAITINSNGTLAPEDTLRTAMPALMQSNYKVNNITLAAYLETDVIRYVEKSKLTLPKVCASCCWKIFCAGGDLIHRHSKENTFDNPSVMCGALKMLYSRATQYILQNGYDINKVLLALS